jgi:hypothetical protein
MQALSLSGERNGGAPESFGKVLESLWKGRERAFSVAADGDCCGCAMGAAAATVQLQHNCNAQ